MMFYGGHDVLAWKCLFFDVSNLEWWCGFILYMAWKMKLLEGKYVGGLL